MKSYLFIIFILLITYSCHRYGNFKLKEEVLNENQIYYNNILDFNSIYINKIISSIDNSEKYRFMRFFPNGRMYIEYWHSKIESTEEEHFNKFNKTNEHQFGQRNYFIFLDSNTIKFECYYGNENGYYYYYAKVLGDTIQIYKTESQTLIKNISYPKEYYYIKKKVDLKPVEVDW